MDKVVIPTVKLNNGLEMPALGFGTWLGLNDKMDFDSSSYSAMVEAISYAIDIGYRHIDTAHLYRVEPEIGEVVNAKINDNTVKREELFITSKVWQHFHRPEDVEVSVRASLKRMSLQYLDLVLMHWPMAITQEGADEHIDYLQTWRGFELVLEKGLVKSIGVSNFNVEQLKRLVTNSKVKPVVNQVEINLNLGQKELVEYCSSQKIIVVAFSPFGTMVPSRHYPNSPEPKMDNPTMLNIAKKYGKTVTQVALRYLFQRGIVSIPKTVTKTRVKENASIFDFELSNEDVATITKFDNGFRTVTPVFWQDYEYYPFDKVQFKMEIPQALKVWKNGAAGNID